jgi:hypothetical protein
VVDNADYLELLLMLRGEIAPEVVLRDDPSTVTGATQHYAVSRWYVHRGQPEQARSLLEKIVASGVWQSFAYMAAEAELRRR